MARCDPIKQACDLPVQPSGSSPERSTTTPYRFATSTVSSLDSSSTTMISSLGFNDDWSVGRNCTRFSASLRHGTMTLTESVRAVGAEGNEGARQKTSHPASQPKRKMTRLARSGSSNQDNVDYAVTSWISDAVASRATRRSTVLSPSSCTCT